MEEQKTLQIIMIGLLLVGGYLSALRTLAQKTAVKQIFPIVAMILLGVFALFGATLLYAGNVLGADRVLMLLLILVALITVGCTVGYLIKNFYALHYGAMVLFVLYLVVLIYVTLLSRDTVGDHRISLFRVDLVQNALQTGSVQPLKHIFLNMVMFLPIGILLPGIDPEMLDDFACPLLFSLTLTVLIEGSQMMLNLGQADLTDIIANVLGGIVGYGVYRLLTRLGIVTQDRTE